jgi:hypothetical protein
MYACFLVGEWRQGSSLTIEQICTAQILQMKHGSDSSTE